MLAVYRGVKYDTNRNLVKETAQVKAVSKYRGVDSTVTLKVDVGQ